MLRGALIIAAVLAVLPSCGGECGDGTLRYGNTCVAVDPFDKTAPKVTVSPGLYTREVGTVRLQSDEPATIYYTIDGQVPSLDSAHEDDTVVIANVPDNAQLRFFAVDLNGNRSNDELRIWIIDRDGPPAPSDFTLTFNAPSRTVGWTPPPDPRFGGVLLARVEGQITSGPVSGKQYAVGDELSPGVTVVRIDGPEVTGATTFNESLAARPGLVRYVAWSFDDLFNYGGAAGAYTIVPMPPQSGSATVNAGTNTFTVTGQPSYLNVAGVATLNGTTLNVDITLRNDTTRVVFAPKLVLTSALPNGITWSNSSGTLGSGTTPPPYRAFGAAIAPGTTATQTLTFAGASSSTQLSLAFDLVDNPIMYATYWNGSTAGNIVDAVANGSVLALAAQTTGPGGDGMTTHGGITPDGRLIVGARTAGNVTAYDLTTGSRVLTSELREQKAQVPMVVLDKSGTTGYAVVMSGHPEALSRNGSGSTKSELVRFDASTLTPGSRLDIGAAKVRGMEISPDGKTLLVATGLVQQGVIVVDLVSFTIKRRIITDFRPQTATFVPGSIEGSSIAIIGERVALYSIDGTPSTSFMTPGTNGKVVRAAFASPTQLWIGRRSELAVLNTNDGTSQTFTTQSGRMLEIYNNKVYAGTSALSRLDLAGTVELATIPGFPTGLDGHWIGWSPF